MCFLLKERAVWCEAEWYHGKELHVRKHRVGITAWLFVCKLSSLNHNFLAKCGGVQSVWLRSEETRENMWTACLSGPVIGAR